MEWHVIKTEWRIDVIINIHSHISNPAVFFVFALQDGQPLLQSVGTPVHNASMPQFEAIVVSSFTP